MKPKLVSIIDRYGDPLTFAEIVQEAARHKTIKPAPLLSETLLREREGRRQASYDNNSHEADSTQRARETAILLKIALFVLGGFSIILIALAVGMALA